MDAERIWRGVEAKLREQLGDDTYDQQLGGIEPRYLDGDKLVVAGDRSQAEWVRRRFGRLLDAAVRDYEPRLRTVQVVDRMSKIARRVA